MRRAIVCAISATALSAAAAAPPHLIRDYLEPPESHGRLERDYRARLRATPFDCGRYAENRIAVLSIYRLPRSDRYFATVINVYDKYTPRQDQLYPFGRFDAELPKSSALAVRDAWRAMLSRLQPPPRDDPYVVLDGMLGEYSLQVSPSGTLAGTLPNVSQRDYGPHLKRFWSLTKLLFDYCRASPNGRGSLAANIEREAHGLTQTLTSTKRSNQAMQLTAPRSVSPVRVATTFNLQPRALSAR
jgi:hypothetical protein